MKPKKSLGHTFVAGGVSAGHLDCGLCLRHPRAMALQRENADVVCHPPITNTKHSWQYLDLTAHAIYTAAIINRSISEGIGDEAKYLYQFDKARHALEQLFEARSEDRDAIIRSIATNHYVSGKLRKNYPTLFADERLSRNVIDAVRSSFQEPNDTDNDGAFPVVQRSGMSNG